MPRAYAGQANFCWCASSGWVKSVMEYLPRLAQCRALHWDTWASEHLIKRPNKQLLGLEADLCAPLHKTDIHKCLY